jgi:hypothetical protein
VTDVLLILNPSPPSHAVITPSFSALPGHVSAPDLHQVGAIWISRFSEIKQQFINFIT